MSQVSSAVTENGVELRISEPLGLPLGTAIRDLAKDEADARSLFALDELWQDGNLDDLEPGRWLVPYERLIHVDRAVASALGLPTPDDGLQAFLNSSGTIVSAGFQIKLEVRHPTHGRLDAEAQKGPAFLLAGGSCVVLTPELWRLAACVADAPPTTAPTESRAEYLGRCVEAGRKAGAELDRYLVENQFDVLEEVKLEIREDGDEIEVGAECDGLPHDALVLPNGVSKPFPTSLGADGRPRRVIVAGDARAKVEEIHGRRRLRGTEVPRFLQNPSAFVPEGLDLSDFSDRVRGFKTRVYNSRPYLHVRQEPRGWLEFDVGISLEPTTDERDGSRISSDEFRDLARSAQESGERFVRHGSGWVEIDPRQAEQFLSVVDRLGAAAGGENRVSRRTLLDVIPNVDVLEFEVELPEGARTERPWMQELPEVALPASFQGQLDPHQLLGFRWLSFLHDRQAGGLLADEMGVGKTPQVLALFTLLHEAGELGPSLLVLPKTLIPIWLRELRRFAPKIDRILEHTGPHRVRNSDYLAAMDVVVTTYDTARADQIMLGTIDWKVVVADEAQFIKNPTAGRTSVVKALKTGQALALTGTPVENGLIEFWCIMDYVQPGLLASWSEFRSDFERPLVEAQGEEERQSLAEGLLARLDPHYLRRLKEEVLESLPQKRFSAPIEVPLGALQEERYRAILGDARERGREAVLGAITKLLITCSHPRASAGDWEEIGGDELIDECPKLAATLDVLESVRDLNEKAVVFTTWKATQRILQSAIWTRFGISTEIVNGDLTTRRQEVIDSFRNEAGFGVLILGPEVAGYGLTLTEANHVIHYTRPWNPAKENQATDRVHRRGQDKEVTVYYPVVRGTVEDKLAELLRDKEQLARDVLRPTSERTVSAEDLISGVDLP